jgi:glyoxylase-like metal-dependent hydrolase (beta-lactamase superfamily II)
MTVAHLLPPGVKVFERGWLSANNILFKCGGESALVDSGYWTHSNQTAALVRGELGDQPLTQLLNTHLHSDHCGGNAALQGFYPAVETLIPPGQASHVRDWDPIALTYTPTGQECPQFRMDGVLVAGQTIKLGGAVWEIHSSPGHDPHAVILFDPLSRALISADALWENGFGVVFQELEGDRAFEEVAQTLELIEQLRPNVVIPGHGNVFSEVNKSLELARRRLDVFVQDPRKHASHAAKVLLKFKLLELQHVQWAEFRNWVSSTPYFALVHGRWFNDQALVTWMDGVIADLVRSGAARREGEWIYNA